jgi:predicted DNA-binding ribbon-helix-helix protein
LRAVLRGCHKRLRELSRVRREGCKYARVLSGPIPGQQRQVILNGSQLLVVSETEFNGSNRVVGWTKMRRPMTHVASDGARVHCYTDTYLNDLLVIGSLKTSVSLENEFWESLKEIARGRGMTVSELVGTTDSTRINGNLSSTLRLFVLDFYRSQGSSELQLANAPASNAALERPGS